MLIQHSTIGFFLYIRAINSIIIFCIFRQSALELERMTEQRKQEEEAWYRQQRLLMEAEDQRRKMLEAEEKKLTDQRARLVFISLLQTHH